MIHDHRHGLRCRLGLLIGGFIWIFVNPLRVIIGVRTRGDEGGNNAWPTRERSKLNQLALAQQIRLTKSPALLGDSPDHAQSKRFSQALEFV